ncbi:MAG: DUF1540 domain-containing protein [Christensenellaceae bacterium]|nr:DUF1540 domain-containing protein [Christensenellaceae bacterium]
MEIRCKQHDCVFNENQNCSANEINVFRCAACGSYRKDENKKMPTKGLFEFSKELAPRKPTETDICCKAKLCLFNDREICLANGITIQTAIGNDSRAECVSYTTK